MGGESMYRGNHQARIRVAMIGGGIGSFMGDVHRLAMTMSGAFELVAGCFSTDHERNLETGARIGISPDRVHDDLSAMLASETERAGGAQAVVIVTPNYLHAAQITASLEHGLHVICEKPLTTSLSEAQAVLVNAGSANKVLAVTHTYTGYPMVRRARQLVLDGALGELHAIYVEYPQSWLATPLERTGQKQAAWRVDPHKSGAGCVGDIGTHAFNLVEFVTGQRVAGVACNLSTAVLGRQVDDNVNCLIRLGTGAVGTLWASQIALGHENDLSIRVFGSHGALEWHHRAADTLLFTRIGEPTQRMLRGGPSGESGKVLGARLPAGHPEGYFEAFATLYRDAAEHIHATEEERQPAEWSQMLQLAADGARAVAFVEACQASSRDDGRWCEVKVT